MGYDFYARLFGTGLVLMFAGILLCGALSHTRRPLQYALWLAVAGLGSTLIGAVGMIWSAP